MVGNYFSNFCIIDVIEWSLWIMKIYNAFCNLYFIVIKDNFIYICFHILDWTRVRCTIFGYLCYSLGTFCHKSFSTKYQGHSYMDVCDWIWIVVVCSFNKKGCPFQTTCDWTVKSNGSQPNEEQDSSIRTSGWDVFILTSCCFWSWVQKTELRISHPFPTPTTLTKQIRDSDRDSRTG